MFKIAFAYAVAVTMMLLCPSLWAQQVPVVPADEAAATFRVAPGYRVELVAAEPLVRDPISMAFDANGKLWVVELQSFMQDVAGTGMYDPIGTIAVLEDTDGDGRMDRRTVFLSGLSRPRAVAFVDDGVLVNDAPNLWFCRDTDGDGACDEQTWVATWGVVGSHENNPGSLTPALDNWIYSSNQGMRVRRQNGQWLLDPTPARGQWGMSQDDRGRLFYSTNREFLRGDLVPVTSSEAHVAGPRVNVYMMPPEEQYTQTWPLEGYYVWPGRPNYGIHRGYWPGALRADGTMISTTASCGPVIYRGDNFPADARGNAFSCEPAGNLVRRMVLVESGGSITARNVYSQSEFLTSTDERFRPVNLFNGPDGCLYIVDMYKGIIVAAEYLDNDYLRDYVVNHGLDGPLHLGRIWRVVSDAAPRGPVPSLATAGSDVLVGYLSHANGWLRDTAQRLLVDRRDPSTVGPLQGLANSGAFPASLHAQWTITGMGNVTPPTREVLLVYGFLDATATLAPGDAALKSRLEGMGYTVTLKEAPQSQTSDADGKILVLISSTVSSDDVGAKFRDVAVPVIDCEHAIFDDMKLTGPAYWTDFGYDQNDPGLLSIVDPSIPLSGGLSGDVQVIGPTGGIEWSDWIVWATTPSSSAIKVAVHADEPSKAAVFAYEAGASMVGMNAPARRMGFFFYRNTAAIATSEGWALFDAAVAWATNSQPSPVNSPPWVAVDAPADGAVFPVSPGASVDITVSGRTTDSDGAVARIEFYDNSTFIGYVPIHFELPNVVTPWNFTWTGVTAGNHALTAVAVDNGGATTSVVITISVQDEGSDLMAYWAFDEGAGLTAADSSGFGNHGTLVHGPVWVPGVSGTALSFNGADSHVTAGGGGSLADLGPLTVTAWIHPNSMGALGLGRIVTKEDGGPGRWMLIIDGSQSLSFAKDYSTQELRRTATPDGLAIGTWQHVAATWNGSASAGSIHLYVNGVEVTYSLNQDGVGAKMSDASIPLTVGNRPSLDRGFDGTIDEIRIYNRVLSAGEIAALAGGGSGVGAPAGAASATGGSSHRGCGATGMEIVALIGLIGLLRRLGSR